jgi:hypothetical protein
MNIEDVFLSILALAALAALIIHCIERAITRLNHDVNERNMAEMEAGLEEKLNSK